MARNPTSGAISFNDLQTTFGGSNPITMGEYNIGGGSVANHENNSAIPTSTTAQVSLSNFYGTGDFYSNDYTQGVEDHSYAVDEFNNIQHDYYYGTHRGGYKTGSLVGSFGTFGSVDVVGTSKSSTAQATIEGIYDYWAGYITPTLQHSKVVFQGSVTGTWWTSITVNGVTKTRTSASTATGTVAGSYTYWMFTGTGNHFSFSGSGTYTVTLIL